jgi:hypothetical protein
MRTIALALPLALFIAACAQMPSVQPASTLRPPAPTSPVPTDAQALEALQAYLGRTLKDPDSVKQFRVLTSPTWTTWRGTGYWVNSMDGGWLVCYELNAKNSYGGYTGLRTEGVVFHVNAGRLVPIQEVNWSAIDPACPVR